MDLESEMPDARLSWRRCARSALERCAENGLADSPPRAMSRASGMRRLGLAVTAREEPEALVGVGCWGPVTVVADALSTDNPPRATQNASPRPATATNRRAEATRLRVNASRWLKEPSLCAAILLVVILPPFPLPASGYSRPEPRARRSGSLCLRESDCQDHVWHPTCSSLRGRSPPERGKRRWSGARRPNAYDSFTRATRVFRRSLQRGSARPAPGRPACRERSGAPGTGGRIAAGVRRRSREESVSRRVARSAPDHGTTRAAQAPAQLGRCSHQKLSQDALRGCLNTPRVGFPRYGADVVADPGGLAGRRRD